MKSIFLRFISYSIKVYKRYYLLAIFMALILILFFPFLFFKKLFPGFDLLLVFYPYSFHFLHSQNFWTSEMLSGFNIGVTPSSFAGNWIYYFLGTRGGLKFMDFSLFYNVIIFSYFIATAILSYLAARMLSFDKWVSIFITSVYIFSAYNLSWMVNIVTAPSLFIFPALIYFLLKFKENFNWFWPIFGGIFLGLDLIASHPQFALVGIFGGFLFCLFLILQKKPFQWKFLMAFLIVCFIGLAISAFQLIPEYRSVQSTQRGMALSFQDSQECALGVPDFARYFIPNFNFGASCESLLYVGILPLLLAIVAIFKFRKSQDDKKFVLFWIFLLVFSLLFSIKYSPLAWLFHQLPIWNGLRGPARFIMIGNFALAVLSGYGFNWILSNKENFKESEISKWIKRVFLSFLILVAGINILGLFKKTFIGWAQIIFDKYYYQKTIGLPLENYHRSIENLINGNFYTFSFLNKNFLIPFTLTTVAFLVIIFIYKFNKTALFYVAFLSGFVWATTSPMVSSGLTRDFFKKTEIVEFLQNQKPPFRIYSLMPNLATYQLLVLSNPGVTEYDQDEFFKTMLPSNLNMVFGLDSIDGYDVSMPKRTAKILAELLSERATMGNKIAEAGIKPEEKIRIFESRKNLLSMMNVRYIISAYLLDENIFKKVFIARTTRFNLPIYIYENEGVLPRFYFARNVSLLDPGNEENAFQSILKSGINFNSEAFIECDSSSCHQDRIAGSQLMPQGSIINSEYKNGYLRLETENRVDSWLVFSESFDKAWRAKINDADIPIYRANYTYQAVRVSAGENTIEFNYSPEFIIK